MPDAVALGIQPPDPSKALGLYSGILGLQQQRQQLQAGALGIEQGQQQLASQTATASIDTRRAQETQRLAGINWKQFEQPDGSYDEAGLMGAATQAAPMIGPQWAKGYLEMTHGAADARQAFVNLTTGQQDSVRRIIAGEGADPDGSMAGLQSKLGAWAADMPKGAQNIADHWVNAVDGAAKLYMTSNPGASQEDIRSAQRRAMVGIGRTALGQGELTGPSGLATPQGVMIGTGAAQVPGAVNRLAPQQLTTGPGLRMGIPPGWDPVEDAYHRKFLRSHQDPSLLMDAATGEMFRAGGGAPQGAPGAAPGATAPPPGVGPRAPAGAPPVRPSAAAAPPRVGFQQPVAGQEQVLGDIEHTRSTTDVAAPTNRNINQHLLELSRTTGTGGWGTPTAQQIALTVGYPSGARYQEIDGYLNRQAMLSASSMGVHSTDAQLAAAQKASGTTEYSPPALQEKVRFADAMNTGAMAYRQGLDRVVGTGPTPDLTHYQAFRSAWSQNFDPDVYRMEDAQRLNDKAEQAAILKRVGTKGAAELARKSKALRQLEQGVLPQ